MTLRVMRTNQYNQDLGLIHSTNGNHLESPNEGSSIDHQVTIYLHAQNITVFPTNETCVYDGVPVLLLASVSSVRSYELVLFVVELILVDRGQNNEVLRSIPLRRRASQVEVEVDELVASVDDMELVMARFQPMNPQSFNGDDPSSDAESWLLHITDS
ncbi:hypothetical protein F511_10417 [Dorcoceras hygrometricum]|uniref:Uncharacterized protein n=1 Tax=Dorcoceras hygrometricum TaxID=472368 RepID=A0A2Z7AUV4_9LAMI|nr:hypothetical protein F511_10417 [Dorcoceras hygrometricum]